MTESLQKEIVNDSLLLTMKFLKQIFFSLYNVIAKYVMEKKYVSVYEFSFYVGLINLIILILFSILDQYYFGLYSYTDYFNNFNSTEVLVMLGVIITQLGINLTTLFTTKNNSPCHVFIIFVFGQLAYYINFQGVSIIVIIFLILILFLSLIFNEILEINILGLSYNTRKNIISRAETESLIKNVTFDEGNENLIELKQNDNEKENE